MCGRFTRTRTIEEYAGYFSAEAVGEEELDYNIAPGDSILAVVAERDQSRHLTWFRWGLVPSWSKGLDPHYSMINARAETLAQKPAYRTPFRRHRCLVVADGFYEWQETEEGKQPYYIRLASGAPMALAGLWDRWESRESGETITSATIITTGANSRIEPIHERMPAVLPPDAFGPWLDPANEDTAQLDALLQPPPPELFDLYPVSRQVNSPVHNGPQLLHRV